MATQAELLKKREETIAFHKNQESVPESPWSPDHPAMKEALLKGDKLLSDRPMAIQDDDRIHVVGECVSKVKAALHSFLDKVAAAPDVDLSNHGLKFQASVVKNCKRALAMVDLEMPTQDWNYCLAALAVENVKLVIVGM